MANEAERSTPVWQALHRAVYLRVAIIVISCLVLTAALVSLKLTLDCDKLPGQKYSRVFHETYAVAGELIYVAVQTALLQIAAVLLIKCAASLLVEWVQVLFLILDFILSCVQLAGYTAGAIGTGVVAHKWATKNSAAYDDVFKAVAGTTAFSSLLTILCGALCVWTLFILYSSYKSTKSYSKGKHKNSDKVSAV